MCDPLSVATDVTCSVCLEIYTDPLVLTCMHSFCRKCLADIHNKASQEGAVGGLSSVSCPNCRKETALDENGTDGLPRNFAIANIAEKLKASLAAGEKEVVLCSLCETDRKPAINTCADCSGTNYCLGCFQLYHPMKGVFRTHVINDISEEPSLVLKAQDVDVMFCQTCEISFNSSPGNSEHDSHDVGNLDYAVQKAKIRLKDVGLTLEKFKATQMSAMELADVEYKEQKGKLEKTYKKFLTSSQNFLSRINDMLQKSSHKEDLSVEGKVSFLRMAKQMSSDVSEYGPVQFFTPQITSDSSSSIPQGNNSVMKSISQDNVPAVRITEIKNLPSCYNTAKVRITWFCAVSKVSIKCFLSKTNEGNTIREEIFIDVSPGTQSLVCGGLRHDTPYMAQLIWTHQGREKVFEQSFYTAKQIYCSWNGWSRDNCHPDVTISDDVTTACHKHHRGRVIKGQTYANNGGWNRVVGVTSYMDLTTGLHYWGNVLQFKLLGQLAGKGIILNVGICESGKEDNFSPLSGNYNVLCVKILKVPKQSNIRLDFWNGNERTSTEGDQLIHVKIRKEYTINLGFLLDFGAGVLKVVMVDEEKILHTFQVLEGKVYAPICEFLNTDKVQASVELHSERFLSLPSVLFD